MKSWIAHKESLYAPLITEKYRLIKYYVWKSPSYSWTLDFSGKPQQNQELIQTFRAKTWKRANERFQEIRTKYEHETDRNKTSSSK